MVKLVIPETMAQMLTACARRRAPAFGAGANARRPSCATVLSFALEPDATLFCGNFFFDRPAVQFVHWCRWCARETAARAVHLRLSQRHRRECRRDALPCCA